MAGENQSKLGVSPSKAPSKDELERRRQEDREVESERASLEKAREQNIDTIKGEENGEGYGNLHYGEERKEDVGRTKSETLGARTETDAQGADAESLTLRKSGEDNGAEEGQSGEPSLDSRGANEEVVGADGPDSTADNNQFQNNVNGIAAQSAAAGQSVDDITEANPPVIFGVGVTRSAVNEAPTDIELSGDAVNENDEGAVVALLSAVDADINDEATFAIVNDSSGAFEIVGNELRLKEGIALDHEAQDVYQIIIEATDASGATVQKTVSVNVTDVNEAPNDLGVAGGVVTEHEAGALVATLTASDPDAGDEAAFALAEDASDLFELVGNELRLKDGVELDHELQDTYNVTIEVTDSGGLTYLETVTINVADINEEPVEILLDGARVGERAPGAVIGTLSVIDPDDDDTASYDIAGDPSGLFEIVGDQLKLKDGVELDYETQDKYSVVVEVTDSGGAAHQETLVINVEDINDTPTDIVLSGANVDENQSGATVATLTAEDQDAGDMATFSLVEDPSGLFEVVGDQLKLKDGVSLDHEAQSAYELTLEVEDASGATLQKTVTVNVTDINDTPTNIDLSNDTIDENVNGAVVATLSAADQDAGDTATFSIADDPSGVFEIVGTQLTLKPGIALDHEVQDSYELTIDVEDSEGAIYSETITVNIADVNDAPIDIVLSDDSVNENDAGAVVATLTATDQDVGDGEIFSLSDDPSGLFEVVGDQLKLKEGVALDHEIRDSYDVTIEVEDSAGATFEKSVTINVADVNEAPVDFLLTPNEATAVLSLNQDGGNNDLAIASNVDGFPTDALTVEVSFTSSQTDVGSGVPLFSYAAGGGSNNEALIWLESSSGKLAIYLAGQRILTDIPNSSLLDGAEHTVSFSWDQASDQLAVYVDGAEEFNRSVSGRNLRADGTVTFGQEQDTEGGRFDANQIFEGEISEVRIFDDVRTAQEIADNADGPLANPADEPGLVTNWLMNEETGGVVQDLAGDNDLVLQNGAEIVGGVAFTSPTVIENDAGGVVGTLSAIDPDTGDAVTNFSIFDDPSGLFEVVGDQLKLKDGVTTDHEAQDSYDVVIAATDDTGQSSNQMVTINVADLNEDPTDIQLTGNTVNENDAGAVVGVFTTTDQDEGDTASYSIADDPSGAFEVVGDQLKLKDGASLDHEAGDQVNLTVRVTDSAGNSYDETVTVNIADINETPTDILLSGSTGDVYQEQGGLLVVEAENFVSNNPGDGHAWGDSATVGAVHVDNGAVNDMWRDEADVETNSPELTYNVYFDTPGTYYVHVRGMAEDGSAGSADSVHIGLNGERMSGDGGITGFGGGGFSWGSRDTYTGNVTTIEITAAGQYELNLWAREDGVSVDKFILTQDPGYSPSGAGPAESPKVGYEAVQEGTAAGTVVATLIAVDPDAGDTHTFEIVDAAGNPVDNADFEIVGNEVRVKVGADLDLENEPTPTLFVKTTDSGGESYTESVTIALADVNEAPTDIVLSNDTVDENDAGAVVATLSAADQDAGDTATYTIVNDPSGAFEIVGDQLKLKDGVELDFESAASHNVVIEARDSAGATYEKTVTVNVENVNAAPSLGLASQSGLAASYYDVGAAISNLKDMDFDAAPDATGLVANLDYTAGNEKFWDGAPNDFFAAKYEGQLNVSEAGSYTISLSSDDGSMLFVDGVPVLDNDGLHATRTRSVTLDLDEGSHDIEVRYFENGGSQTLQMTWSGPDTGGARVLVDGDALSSGAQADALSLSDDAEGMVVAALAVTDADTDDMHSFTVSDDRFEVVEIDGAPTLKLKEGVAINYETEASVDVSVTVTDAAGESDTADFSIAIADDNTAPTIDVAGGEGLVASYYDVGASISNLSEIDFDAAPDATDVVDSLDYMTGNEKFWDAGPDNYFAAKYEGELVVETGGSYTINLASDDGSMLFVDGVPVIDNDSLHGTVTQSATLNLDAGAHDIEVRYFENTGAQTLQMTWSGPDTGGATELVDGAALRQPGTYDAGAIGVTENVAGDVAALLSATDAEGDAITFDISDDRFEVVDTDEGLTLKLKDGEALDFETEPSVDVIVTATDEHGESSWRSFEVTVNDVDREPILGTPGNDRLNGTNDADVIDGLAGDDIINGRGGDDTIIGGAGNDRLNGGSGDDTFVVSGTNDGFDRFNGGVGNDRVVAGADNTEIGLTTFNNHVEEISADGFNNVSIVGSSANNTLTFTNTNLDGIVAIDGGAGNDRITGSAGDDTIIGGAGNDQLTGGLGNDTFVVSGTGDGLDRFVGGGGNDAIIAGSDGTEIAMSSYNNGVETISAAGFDDVSIVGNAGNNSLNFSSTDLDGVDFIDGGAGNDRITGSTGDDLIVGGAGNDRLNGGSGDDTFTVSGDDQGFDQFNGGQGADQILAGADATTIGLSNFNNSVETISANGFNGVTLEGTGGNNTLNFSTTDLDGIESIDGGAGNDRITGSTGDDVIYGGVGNDRVIGGDGHDLFVYEAGDGNDTFNGGGGGWTDAIQFADGLESLGVLGVDWTIDLTQGSIVSSEADNIELSNDADGMITLNDGSMIEFTDLEQII